METFNSTSGKIDLLVNRGYQLRTMVYFGQALDLIKRHISLFASFTLVYFAFLFMVLRLAEIGSFLHVLVAGPISAGYYLVVHRIAKGQEFNFENFFDGFKRYLPLMGAALAANFLASIGFMLYIVPGFIIALLLIFVMPLVVFGKIDLLQSLKYSLMIVWKQFWEMSKFGLVLLLINLAGVMTFGIGLLFTLPVSFAAIYFAYSDLVGIEEEKSENKPDFSHFR